MKRIITIGVFISLILTNGSSIAKEDKCQTVNIIEVTYTNENYMVGKVVKVIKPQNKCRNNKQVDILTLNGQIIEVSDGRNRVAHIKK